MQLRYVVTTHSVATSPGMVSALLKLPRIATALIAIAMYLDVPTIPHATTIPRLLLMMVHAPTQVV